MPQVEAKRRSVLPAGTERVTLVTHEQPGSEAPGQNIHHLKVHEGTVATSGQGMPGGLVPAPGSTVTPTPRRITPFVSRAPRHDAASCPAVGAYH